MGIAGLGGVCSISDDFEGLEGALYDTGFASLRGFDGCLIDLVLGALGANGLNGFCFFRAK